MDHIASGGEFQGINQGLCDFRKERYFAAICPVFEPKALAGKPPVTHTLFADEIHRATTSRLLVGDYHTQVGSLWYLRPAKYRICQSSCKEKLLSRAAATDHIEPRQAVFPLVLRQTGMDSTGNRGAFLDPLRSPERHEYRHSIFSGERR